MRVLPHLSAFALAAARLAWPIGDCATISLHGRPLATLAPHLAPGARLIALTRDGAAPAEIAGFLAARGWGGSRLAALERLGGPAERRLDGTAAGWPHKHLDDLTTLAIECVAGPDARPLPLLAGLPDDCFEHDGQITKRHVRAATLASLAPLPGQLLWDVGAGSGSISIEWLRAAPRTRAFAVERDAGRRARIARNAEALGVPHLEIVAGEAPAALDGLAAPDAVFVGGGASPETIGRCWTALKQGGTFVANAVTDATAALLAGWRAGHGGDLTRIAVSHAEDGRWHDAAPIVQYAARKT